MIRIRRSSERGHADHGWLNSFHTFSFADYHDPKHMSFGALRVINEDRITPGAGFPTHPHRDMEIISYVLEGAIEHKDSMGTGSVIRPGDVQRMTAGRGVTHSEYNHSKSEGAHFLQIWILPNKPSLSPGYEQKTFSDSDKRGKWRLVASEDGREGSLVVHQDVALHVANLAKGEKVPYEAKKGRRLWLQVARGTVKVGAEILNQGDGAAVSDEAAISVEAEDASEVLLFDLS
jgi:redox-sensitive bicupin YhaK (pirin superfamily)